MLMRKGDDNNCVGGGRELSRVSCKTWVVLPQQLALGSRHDDDADYFRDDDESEDDKGCHPVPNP